MFKKILIANRGEIALRVVRACREMDIPALTLYDPSDIGSLHVGLADECVQLEGPADFKNSETILKIALEKGADAIHPGYGFLSERADFIRVCTDSGITFIGPPAEIVDRMSCKVEALERARAAGFSTVEYSRDTFGPVDLDGVRQEAQRLGYPVVIKSCQGGRGPGERVAHNPDQLLAALQSAQAEALAFYGDESIYLEKAILPARPVGVQILGDRQGNVVHLGEYQALVHQGNRKMIAETPAPGLTTAGREGLWNSALELAREFNIQNAATVEFLIDGSGQPYFTEFKPYIQLEHPLIEATSQIDLVQQQILLASGEPLPFLQEEIRLRGASLLCRINAEDPWNSFLPSPGHLRQVLLPGGPHVRIDTYIYSGCNVPGEYDPLIAKVTTWGEDRPAGLAAMRRALEECKIAGTETNLTLLKNILSTPEFIQGVYSAGLQAKPPVTVTSIAGSAAIDPETHLRDLAVIAASLYLLREQCYPPVVTGPQTSGWRRRNPSTWNYSGITYEKDSSDR